MGKTQQVLIYVIICNCIFSINIQQGYSQDIMFRGNSAHDQNYSGFNDKIFNKILWKFETGGCIRSTAVVVENTVIVGSGDGFLYALDKKTGRLKWKYNCGSSVNSSPAYSKGIIFISSRKQELFAIQLATGNLSWKKNLGEDKYYDWGFDYYSSSPVINGDTLFIGVADGGLEAMDKRTGKSFWRFQAGHGIKSTPAIKDGWLYIGDIGGDIYALHSHTGKQQWIYNTLGSTLNNDSFGFDRKAIIGSPIIKDNQVIVGSRDGLLYNLNRNTGEIIWKQDHEISWIISSPAISNDHIFVGTSDKAFVQSVDLNSGKESWRTTGSGPVWSSPIIIGNKLYVGSQEGVLRCLDVQSGKKIPHPFCINASIFSSPVMGDSLVYIGADNGIFYCIQAETLANPVSEHYVYWDKNAGFNFFKNGVDIIIRDYLLRKGYTILNKDELKELVLKNKDNGAGKVIAFASLQLPEAFLKTDSINIFHDFLKSGGMAVGLGNNLFAGFVDEKGYFEGFDFRYRAAILEIPFTHNDLRTVGGIFTSVATNFGKSIGMKQQWISNSSVDPKQVNSILGIDERGNASAWMKKIGRGNYIQLWINQQFPENYDFVDEVIKYFEKTIGK